MQSTPRGPKQVLVLQKTFDIIESLKSGGSGTGLTEVARRVGMPKATVYRILTTLEIRGYLDRSVAGGYRMSDKFFALQRDLSPEQRMLRAAAPVMERIAAECRETVNLGTFDGGEIVVIATVESPQTVRMASKVGNRRYIHSTAIGKALLASMDEAAVARLLQLKGLPVLTPHTLAKEADVIAEIRNVRRRGYAIDDQENELEGRCIAVKVPAECGMAAALSISVPVFRMDVKRLRALAPTLHEGCGEIARTMAEQGSDPGLAARRKK